MSEAAKAVFHCAQISRAEAKTSGEALHTTKVQFHARPDGILWKERANGFLELKFGPHDPGKDMFKLGQLIEVSTEAPRPLILKRESRTIEDFTFWGQQEMHSGTHRSVPMPVIGYANSTFRLTHFLVGTSDPKGALLRTVDVEFQIGGKLEYRGHGPVVPCAEVDNLREHMHAFGAVLTSSPLVIFRQHWRFQLSGNVRDGDFVLAMGTLTIP